MGNNSSTNECTINLFKAQANPAAMPACPSAMPAYPSAMSDDPLAPVKDHCKSLSEKDKGLLKFAIQKIADKSFENVGCVIMHYEDYGPLEVSLKCSTSAVKRVHIAFNENNEPAAVLERVDQEVDKLDVESFQKLSEDIVSSGCID